MINPSDVATGLLGLGVIAGAVGLVAIGGRDPQADEHSVADYQPAYRPTLAPSRRHWPLTGRQDAGRRRLRARAMADLILPPAADVTVPLPLYAETVVAGVVRARYGTTDPAEVARRMLREIAAAEQTRTADRDMTGALSVVVA